MTDKQSLNTRRTLDPVVVHGRREGLWILLTWVFFMVWTVGYSSIFGYNLSVEEIKLVLGIPAWVFWGVVVPWLAATGFSIYFAMNLMVDDDLESNGS